MANLSRIVSVQIQLNTTGISKPSFSDMLIAAPHALSKSRMMAITSSNELLDMGLSPTTKLYKAAKAAFSQIPHVDKVYIGRQSAATTKIEVTQKSVGDYKVTIKKGSAEDTVTQTATASSTIASIATGLATKIAALSTVTAATASGGVITVQEADIQIKVEGKLKIGDSTSTENWATALNEIKNEGGSWYGVTATTRDETEVTQIAEWVEANKRLFVTSSSDSRIVDGSNSTDIASKVKNKQMFRTAVCYDEQADSEYTEIASMAKLFTYYPGGATWANKRLAGITADYLPEGEAIVAHGKNASTFEMFNGDFAITQGGKVASGEWIDVIRFRDWLEAEIQTDVAFALINADGKVPYTDAGIEMLANAMLPALELGVSRGGIAPPAIDNMGNVIPSFVIEKPRASSISSNNKASRVLKDLKFTARLAGAIHIAEIKGSLAYDI